MLVGVYSASLCHECANYWTEYCNEIRMYHLILRIEQEIAAKTAAGETVYAEKIVEYSNAKIAMMQVAHEWIYDMKEALNNPKSLMEEEDAVS